MGLITGPPEFPAVANLATLAGPGDSTLALLALSLPNSLLRFQRDGKTFVARYVVSLRMARDSQVVKLVDRRETVRVADFTETTRTDESVIFQTAFPLPPGPYELRLRVRDGLSARGFQELDTVLIPAYGPGASRLALPRPVYRATPRASREEMPELVLNPRHAIPYGGQRALVYLESYQSPEVRLELTTAEGQAVWTRELVLDRGQVAAGVVELPVDSLPLGRFWLRAEAEGEATEGVPFLISLSDRWLVSNFDEVLDYLRYIASPAEVSELREGSPTERRERWESFWAALDPVPATPVNEYRETFFERVRTATEQFGEPGRAGWLTDRGEVYIVLGPPTRLMDVRRGREATMTGQANAEQWIYDRVPGGGSLRLLFVDRGGFGEYRLTPSSDAAFRGVAERLRLRRAEP